VDDSYSLVDAAKEHRVHTKWGHVAFYEGDGKIARLAASPSGATMLTIAVRRRGENRGTWFDHEISCQWPAGRSDAQKLCWMLDGAYQRGEIAKAKALREVLEV